MSLKQWSQASSSIEQRKLEAASFRYPREGGVSELLLNNSMTQKVECHV